VPLHLPFPPKRFPLLIPNLSKINKKLPPNSSKMLTPTTKSSLKKSKLRNPKKTWRSKKFQRKTKSSKLL
jgi:hypothetical protein